VGAGGEQPDSAGGGSGASGDRVPVEPEGQNKEKEQETAGDKPAVSAPAYFQMSLFPTVEEQVERIAQTKEEEKRAVSPASGKSAVPEVAKGVIGRALTSGSNEKGSTIRIAAFYQKSPSVGEAAAFLQNEYGTDGKGLTIAGEKYAMWFDKEGIKIAPGRTANVPGATLVTWEQAAGQVSELLEGGIYAAQEILDTARANEYQELAAQLRYLRQDLSEEAVKRGYLPRVSALYGGFPDSTEKIAGLLEEKISRDGFAAELTDFVRAYEADPDLMRFHFHNPQAVLSRLSELDIEPKQFHALEDFEPAKGSFITEDEIDRMFSRGSGVSEGKMRIYSYFMQGHDAKERADFLKNEYGTGGYGSMGHDEWHDSKGIKFTRSDEASGFDGYDTVKMNWNQVQKRIGELIDTGRYLNPKEMAYTSEYEKIQLARSIYAFYYYCPNTPNPGNSPEWDVNAAERDFKPMLDEPKYSAALYEDMVESFATVTPEESRSYSIMQKAIEDMGAYQRGEYSLFTPLPEETLRAERQKREAAKKEAKEKQNAPKKEKEPAGELEAAARALAKKQKGKVKERADGQLAFDFAAVGAEDAGQAGTDLKDADSSLEKVKAQEEDILSRYDIGYGFMGNGLTVWNRLEEEHGDYKTIAHIDADRSVKFYDEKLPEIVREQIRKVAAETQMNISATQEAPVFSTPPQAEPEIQTGEKGEVAPAGKSPVEIYREALSMLSDVVRQSSFYSYLRDRETDYDGAAAELDNELGFFINEIAESQPELYDAFQSLPMFRAWMVEDILERTYQDVVTDSRDAIERHTGDVDAPEWAKETEADGNRTEISYQDGKPVIQEEPAPVLEETEKSAGTKQEDTNLTPNVEEYLNLKAEHPDKLVGVEVGEYILFYGKDAQAAAPALSAKLLTKEIPVLGETPVTGGKGWQAVVKDLLEHGQSVVIARPDPERGENAPYEIVKERDIADYIPLGMKLNIDGRHMEVDSIDYENGRVSLKDLDMQGWFPIFREESVPFVRECVEQEWANSLESGELPEEAPQAEKEAGGQEEEAHTLADSADFKEAMRLLEDFCNSEYDDGAVDLGNPEHLEIAFTNTEDEQHDIQVEVNLLDHSISQFFDGVCVDKREYGSIRELIDTELSRLDFDELVRLDASVEKLLDRPGSSELEEAKRLIEDFCLDEYEQDSVDFGNLTKVPLAYGVTDSGGLEVQVNVDLIHFSLSQYVDGKCVEERQYDSLRELIDGELAFLDYDQLIYLEPGIEERLEAELNEKIRWEEMQGAREGVTPTEWETTGREEEEPPDMVEIEGGEIVTEGPAEGYSTGLPYDIVIEKLHFGPDRHNFHITDDALGTGGQKAKYQDNLAAIWTLTQIEAENRLATEQEQEVLSRYVGWGGLSQAFDADNEKWGKEYTELKELLTPAEYESARSTVLNAHYTSPIVIKAMYEAVKRMDFTPGNILEPSCGIGNFFGLVPEEFEKSNLYGVELDSLTGRIAKQLYQKADITVGGFETTEHPNDFFDLAVGNVPFGEYKVHDKQYDKQNLLIHDYFLTKTLDKVRPGGVVAFITSKGTMDKANGKVREALAQKADLLGAVRLPNNAFKANAGTDVTADILFFQKRGSAPEKLPDWVNVGQTEDGIPINNYYLQNPDMVLGKMAFWENMYGNATETACVPLEGADLKEQLAGAVTHIKTPDRELLHMDAPEQAEEEKAETIPADPHVRNFSFTEKDGKLYFRENSRMKQIEVGKTPAARIRGMIAIRDSARRLIDLQLSGAEDAEIGKEQAKLNALYDNFQKKYGLLSSAGNRLAFRQDSSYPLLCSLEVLDEEGNLKRKADMFTKRTIQHRQPVTSVDTAVEALGVSIGERACVDLGFMASLMGGRDKIPQIISDLKGIIFKDPDSGPAVISEENTDWHKGWQTADEYLSGDVRRKLEKAKKAAEEYPEFSANVEALLAVQPKDLTAPEISVRIGAPWIDTKYYKQFLFELLQTPGRLQNGRIDVLYSDVTGEWRIKGKSEDSITNTRVHTTYGTKRINAYEIFEASLNQRSVQIFDTHRDADGKETRVLNEKETAIAQQKQDAMKEAFHDWIFKDPERRTDLCAVYNRMFNSTRPREYDGRHINFIGMNPEIRLEPHQRNAVARILYGGNTLLAHVVGAGKTYEMIAAAMESKRLGLCKKSIMVVPNHLTEQWGGDFLTLYPGAKVLVATKKDFEPKNRKRFCARIATGDYDAVIIGHSQFEKIPISPERQMAIIQDQIDEIVSAIAEAKANREEKFTVKQMEKTKKNLEAKMKKLYDKKKDDTVTFEELGVDRLFVDEAHSFKNLYMHTKMRNVAGISQTDAQKSSDMFAKCRYMDEITGGRGVVFATGTPVSNSMVELYTMMRYLQYSMLEDGYRDSTGKIRSLKHFDNWAATFGEQVTAVELKPEGTGFRLKTRFARFYNLPELINRWKEAADIQTADMLKLPVPEAEYVTVQTEPSEAQKAMVKSLADRAEKIRKEKIDPRIDNMLKITSDGRKLALDQRIMNPLLPDDPGSKVNACVDNVFRIWQESAETKGTQLIFSDLSTPKGKAEPKKEEAKENTEGTETEAAATEEETAMEASVYEDIRKKLIAKGIPPQEIAFIHDANTETQKAELFAKVRNGQVRVLLGSTQKMGAGTNVQTKLVASHDLDCPWRPADVGRILRTFKIKKNVEVTDNGKDDF
jgi:N12 class adenine-specific DNA methylase